MDMEDLAQTAFSAYVDAAQDRWVEPHQRLEAGSRAAAIAVHAHIKQERRATRRVAKHGTYSGYSAGCRCKWCSDARRAYEGAYYYLKGDNDLVHDTTLTS